MITFEEAFQITTKQVVLLPSERIHLEDALGRILAEDIFSDMNMPPFDKSAVDGYACRMEDLTANTKNELALEIIETIPAGVIPQKKISTGQCSKIMTGSMLPEGCDSVVMIEDTERVDETRVRLKTTGAIRNICYTGEDIKNGDMLLNKGKLMAPQHIGVLAVAGAVNPLVYRKVKVAVISTGNELVEPEELPGPSKIRNSNAGQLMAQVTEAHALVKYYGIAKDDEKSLDQKITLALESNDVVILTGGASMGEFDYVPGVLEKNGAEILIENIAIQPGKPTVFAKINGRFIFGLPGNPVSSFVIFKMLVRPFLMKLMGNTEEFPVIILPMGKNYTRKNTSRKSMIPVKIIKGALFPVEYHGSAHINSYADADGIISLEIGKNSLTKGELVNVRQI